MEMLRTRTDCVRQVLRLGGGENEEHALGRLFERFQQRVRSFLGELVGFVQDDHAVAPPGGGVADHLAQLADLVNAAIAGRVDFHDVQRATGGDVAAEAALIARLGRRPLLAVQRLGQDARRGRLSHAALAGKNVRGRDAPGLYGVCQRACDVLLPRDIFEPLRPPFPCNHLVAHSTIPTR